MSKYDVDDNSAIILEFGLTALLPVEDAQHGGFNVTRIPLGGPKLFAQVTKSEVLGDVEEVASNVVATMEQAVKANSKESLTAQLEIALNRLKGIVK